MVMPTTPILKTDAKSITPRLQHFAKTFFQCLWGKGRPDWHVGPGGVDAEGWLIQSRTSGRRPNRRQRLIAPTEHARPPCPNGQCMHGHPKRRIVCVYAYASAVLTELGERGPVG